MNSTRENLLAYGPGTAATLLSPDPGQEALTASGGEGVVEVVSAHPDSSLGWALLAEDALAGDTAEGNVQAYAYARTGYHRGLDALRRVGWKGAGPIPWEHESNRGFLRSLWSLAEAARRIGEADEAQRCAQFLRDASATGYAALIGQADQAD